MRINTRTGSIELTKQEQRTLDSAKLLLVKLAKHGEGALSEAADIAADKIGEAIKSLNAVEETAAT